MNIEFQPTLRSVFTSLFELPRTYVLTLDIPLWSINSEVGPGIFNPVENDRQTLETRSRVWQQDGYREMERTSPWIERFLRSRDYNFLSRCSAWINAADGWNEWNFGAGGGDGRVEYPALLSKIRRFIGNISWFDVDINRINRVRWWKREDSDRNEICLGWKLSHHTALSTSW